MWCVPRRRIQWEASAASAAAAPDVAGRCVRSGLDMRDALLPLLPAAILRFGVGSDAVRIQRRHRRR